MSNLYVNLNEIKNFDPRQPTIITLAQDKTALYRDAALHHKVEQWIKSHESDSEDSFGKQLFFKVLLPVADASIDSAPRQSVGT